MTTRTGQTATALKSKDKKLVKKIEHLAWLWEHGDITAQRFAEAVFGLINGGVK